MHIQLWYYVWDDKERKQLNNAIIDTAAHMEDDLVIKVRPVFSADEFYSHIDEVKTFDVCCFDTVPIVTLEKIRKVRQLFPHMLLMLLVDDKLSPLQYIRPGILPTTLLMKPFSNDSASNAITELLNTAKEVVHNENAKTYIIETKQERMIFKYSEILYFEARDKKLFLNTVSTAYPFYSTLDKLIEELPKEFIRCHKSFIVNKYQIRRIDFSSNEIHLRGGAVIPVSRSYRADVRRVSI